MKGDFAVATVHARTRASDSFVGLSLWLRRVDMRLLAFGDSLTIGVTLDGPRVPYSTSLEREIGASIDSVGWAGITSDSIVRGLEGNGGLLTRVKAAAEAGEPYDAVLLLLGTNDFLRDSYNLLLPNLRALHAAVRDWHPRQCRPCREPHERVDTGAAGARRLNEQIASGSGASHFIDTATLVPFDEDSGHLWASDGTHMSAAGYEALGTALAAPLRSKLAAILDRLFRSQRRGKRLSGG